MWEGTVGAPCGCGCVCVWVWACLCGCGRLCVWKWVCLCVEVGVDVSVLYCTVCITIYC